MRRLLIGALDALRAWLGWNGPRGGLLAREPALVLQPVVAPRVALGGRRRRA